MCVCVCVRYYALLLCGDFLKEGSVFHNSYGFYYKAFRSRAVVVNVGVVWMEKSGVLTKCPTLFLIRNPLSMSNAYALYGINCSWSFFSSSSRELSYQIQ